MLIPTASSALTVAAGGAFNPQTDITWHSLFWAEGSAFTALGLTDTDLLVDGTGWPNETTEVDASVVVHEGTGVYYSESVAALSNQPAIFFGNTNAGHGAACSTTNFSSAPSYASGVSIVAIVKPANTGVTWNQYLVDGNDTSNKNIIGISQTGAVWMILAGGSAFGSTRGTNGYLLVAQFDGSTGNDTLTIDGTIDINADAGSETLDGIKMGAYSGNSTNGYRGHLAFVGIYEGDFTADSNYAAFCTWAETHYGLTIA